MEQNLKLETLNPSIMKTSEYGINLIKDLEGFHPSLYLNVANNPAIGYGHTQGLRQSHKNNLKKNKPLTRQEAHDLLLQDLEAIEPAVMDLLRRSPLVYVDGVIIGRQYQFDALVSFAYNCGTSALKHSGLAKAIADGMPEHIIRAQFESWCFVDDRPSPELVHRRLLESDLYFGITYPEIIETNQNLLDNETIPTYP